MKSKILRIIFCAACIGCSIAGGFLIGKTTEKKRFIKEVEKHFEEEVNE